jgi:hypothetical protein
MLTKAPVLAYYDGKSEVTIQCDSSQAGIGAVLLQDGKPVTYTSRAMTPTEQRYAQIEKEMLAIVHSCTKFDQYIYGRLEVKVQSDHKPLETIFKKPIASSPKRLQRMLLFLQKYSLKVEYKKGKHMYIADTLSRAYLKQYPKKEDKYDVLAVEEFEICQELEAINLTEEVPNSKKRMEEIRSESKADETLQQVRKYVLEGWPESCEELKSELKPYYNV